MRSGQRSFYPCGPCSHLSISRHHMTLCLLLLDVNITIYITYHVLYIYYVFIYRYAHSSGTERANPNYGPCEDSPGSLYLSNKITDLGAMLMR